MQYTVEVTLRARAPLTEEDLFSIAEMGGVAVGRPGERHLETAMTIQAARPEEAARIASQRVTERIAGTVVALEAMTVEEADRRNETQSVLVGVSEIAKMLGLTRQRVSALSKRADFPSPLATLASGPVWRAGDLTTFAAGWRRSPGRPRAIAAG